VRLLCAYLHRITLFRILQSQPTRPRTSH
jgi:hypothetical protein